MCPTARERLVGCLSARGWIGGVTLDGNRRPALGGKAAYNRLANPAARAGDKCILSY